MAGEALTTAELGVRIPLQLTLQTALSILIIIAGLTVSAILLGWLFTRLQPRKRRDVIALVRAVCRGLKESP